MENNGSLKKMFFETNQVFGEQKERGQYARAKVCEARQTNCDTMRRHDAQSLGISVTSLSQNRSLKECANSIASVKAILHRLKVFDEAEKQRIAKQRREMEEMLAKFADRTKLDEENAVLDQKIGIAKQKLEQRKKDLAKLVAKKEDAKAGLARTKAAYADKMTKTVSKRSEVKLRLMNIKMERQLMARFNKK